MRTAKPTKTDLIQARGLTNDDLIGHDLKILFCGINSGLYSAATGFHFARPGNRFWKAVHLAGFTDRQLDPSEEHEFLELGYGITGFCRRATASASELSREEIVEGGERLVKRVEKYRPRILAVLAMTAYRIAFNRPKAKLGPQEEKIGDTRIWLLPNPSGLNANYQLPDFVRLFIELKKASEL
ncbi:MAG: G/U mismatch-specific DNA glycosylase [Acidobacteria bacterium]|nr:G/U mismatch-specific DNA glycosylase [Acidobacteriota bacterium]